MLFRLLRKNISILQIAGYALANLVGLAIILVAIKFYGDTRSALRGDDDSEISTSDYLVLSRPVSMLSTLGIGQASGQGIPQSDIADLEKQPWVKEVGEFTAANFSITGSVEIEGRGVWSYLFLEAVPDRFIDIMPSDWKFDSSNPNANDIPIIISKDYLALYNFGFAASRGLPQLSEGLVSQIPITLYLNGNGYSEKFRAHIAGFSTRLNTIAVPYSFMQWANARYSTTPASEPSRLIVEVTNPGDPEIAKYLSKNGLEVAGDRLDQGKASFFLNLVTTIVVVIGAVICILAFFIFMLSITLLLQKNKEKNSNLLLLGYSPMQVSSRYFALVGTVNSIVLVLAVAIMLVASHYWEPMLSQLGIAPSSAAISILCGVAIILIVTIFNFVSIYNKIRRSF